MRLKKFYACIRILLQHQTGQELKMTIFANGMGGGIGRFLWPPLEKLGAVRIASRLGLSTLVHDLKNPPAQDKVHFAKGDILIFLAALSKPGDCARNPREAWRINVENTGALIERALSAGARVLFFSSDTVYGNQDGPLDESASLKAEEPYGRMKAAVETRFCRTAGFTALRLSYVVSPADGVTTYLQECARTGNIAEVFAEYARNMIGVEDVVEAVLTLTRLAQTGCPLPPAVNLAGKSCVTRLEMAKAYRDAVAPNLSVREIPAPDGFFSVRPKKISLDVSLLTSLMQRSPHLLTEVYRNAILKGELQND